MRRRVRTAWAVSALVHALVFAALLWRRTAGPPVEAPRPLSVEIELGEPRVEPEARTAVPPVEPAPVRRRPPGQPRAELAPPEPAAGAPAARDDDSAPAAPPDTHDRGPGPAPDLSLRALAPEVRQRIAGAAPEAIIEAKPHRPSVDELRVEVERAEDAVANVRGGRVDPLLYDYLRGARARFEDDARQLADQLALGPSDTVRGWGRGYLERVDQVHKEGAGINDSGSSLSDEAAMAPARRYSDVLGALGEASRSAEAGAERRHVEICLDVAPAKETTATLRGGSGNVALDRVALDAFRRAVAARPVPPDARAGRACYEVRISAFRAPPLPYISCGLDRKGVSCIWPFKKVTSVTGRLLSVEYPPEPASSSSLLRKPR